MCPNVQLTGLHPRSERLIDLTRAYDRGRASWDQVNNQLIAETSEIIRLQQDLGFDYLSDGALSWQDPLRPLTQSLAGVTSGTRYSRWFDTNTFYQKPVITSRVTGDGFKPSHFIKTEVLPKDRKWKISLPGPYTFSELSENHHYQNKSDLVLDLANALREIVRKLIAKGVSLVQLSEPSLVYRPYRRDEFSRLELELALDSISRVVDGVKADFLVHTFFGDATPVLEHLLELPISAVGLDLYETDFSKLEAKTSKEVLFGTVDSRESSVESPAWIAETVQKAAKHLHTHRVTLAPNSDLKFLPQETANMKLVALGEAVRILKEAS